MNITRIEVNTTRLRKDSDSVLSYITSIEKRLENLQRSFAALNSVWEGAAKEQFEKAVGTDMKAASSVMKELKAIYSYEDNAVNVYEQCEKTIAGIIADIKI